MADFPQPDLLSVPVDGGQLTVARWGSGDRAVVAPHGITANHVSWAYVADALGDDVTLLAPDLRGRGGSAGLPGPYGMATHVADCVAILDHLEIDRAVMAGHSMGGFVCVKAGANHADRFPALVMIDGGIPLPVPDGMEIDDILNAVIGPAMERLSKTFESREAYRDYWRVHPAFEGQWNDLAQAYVDYDIHEIDGAWQSRVDADVIRADGRDTLVDTSLLEDFPKLELPIRFVWAGRGIMNEDPLYPRVLIEQQEQRDNVTVRYIDDGTNHYTLLLSRNGAGQVAEEIRAATEQLG